MTELPHFKYQPNALKLGLIEKKNFTCSVCEIEREYAHVGGMYTAAKVTLMCPWCVADGSAAKKYDGVFIDATGCEKVTDPRKITELVTTTPKYLGWQEEAWLAHCDDYCAFMQYVGWKEIQHLKDDLMNDIEKIKSDWNFSQLEFEQSLVNGSGTQGYLFKCLHCDHYRLHVDLN